MDVFLFNTLISLIFLSPEVAKASQERENLGMLVWFPNPSIPEAKCESFMWMLAGCIHNKPAQTVFLCRYWHFSNFTMLPSLIL